MDVFIINALDRDSGLHIDVLLRLLLLSLSAKLADNAVLVALGLLEELDLVTEGLDDAVLVGYDTSLVNCGCSIVIDWSLWDGVDVV